MVEDLAREGIPISRDGLAVTTHRSVPSSPLVVGMVGMKRRQLSWQRGVWMEVVMTIRLRND